MLKGKKEDQLPRANLDYSEELYKSYLKNPSEVEDSWRWFFQGLSLGLDTSSQAESLSKELKVFQLLQFYRDHGNLKAQLNPLEDSPNKIFPKLEDFQITQEDLNKPFAISDLLFNLKKPLKDVLAFLEKKILRSSLNSSWCMPSKSQTMVF